MASRKRGLGGIGEQQPDAPGCWGVRTDSGEGTCRGRNKGVGALCSAPWAPLPPVSWVLSRGNAAAPPTPACPLGDFLPPACPTGTPTSATAGGES